MKRKTNRKDTAVDCPSDVVGQLWGWATKTIGANYGRGYAMDVVFEWLKKLLDKDCAYCFIFFTIA